jgi:hypothetical protein
MVLSPVLLVGGVAVWLACIVKYVLTGSAVLRLPDLPKRAPSRENEHERLMGEVRRMLRGRMN